MIGRADLQDLGAGAAPPVVLPAWSLEHQHLVLPHALTIATRPDGTPELRLELARGADEQHGTLDLRLTAACDLDGALAAVRATDPAAVVRPAAFGAGWLWLAPGLELGEPQALGGLGVGAQRWTRRVDPTTATLLREVLESDVALLRGHAHLELPGVAPRLPVKVRFDAAALTAAVRALAPAGQAHVDRSVLLAALRADPAALGLQLLGEVDDDQRERLTEALADLVRAEVGAPHPGTPDGGPALAIAERTDGGAAAPTAGPVERDLRMPLATHRPLALALAPLTTLAGGGSGAEIVQTELPELVTGSHAITVLANVPPQRTGVLALGAQLTAAPTADRPQAAVEGVELLPPTDSARAVLVLGPLEPLRFSVAATAVLQAGDLVEPLTGQAEERDGTFVRLDADAFPVRFLTVEAAPGLLALARVDGSVDGTWRDRPCSWPLVLDPATPTLAVALPRDLQDARLRLRARPLAAEAPAIELSGLPAQDLRLDLHGLPGFGPQAVALTGEGVVELQPEAADAPPTALQLPGTWTWFAASPFAPGFRVRRAPDAPWSEVHPPGVPLDLGRQAVPA